MAFYIACVIIATVPIYFAAVQAWVWPFYAAAMMLAYILFRWQNRLNKAKRNKPKPFGQNVFVRGLPEA